MKPNSTRRQFLNRIGGGSAAATLGSMLGGVGLPRVSAAEAGLENGAIVRFRSELEPLVRYLEETPRDRVIEGIVGKIKTGLSYREVVGALLLAGVRNVEPRPAVGFKFHAVLVVHSAHLASAAGPDSDRWLPILWAIDDFKASQARDTREGNWTMGPVDEAKVPPPHRAREAFVDAMDNWDEEAADAAAAGISRALGAGEIFDLYVPYAARDLRSIGHKAIYLANAWRTLQVMGWNHAEPVLRSLAYALLNRRGDPNPATHDLSTDRPWRENGPLSAELPNTWREGGEDAGATRELLATFRGGVPGDAAKAAATILQAGAPGPAAVTDALFVGASELMLRQPAIPALHAVTTTNAMHYLYRNCGNDGLRRRLLLQSSSFLPMFLEFMRSRGEVEELRLDKLEAADKAEGAEAVLAIRNGREAAKAVLGFVDDDEARAREVMDRVRRRIFLAGTDAHHYKFSSAVLEDFYHVSPSWRARLLACGSQYLPRGRENPLVGRIRAAVGG